MKVFEIGNNKISIENQSKIYILINAFGENF